MKNHLSKLYEQLILTHINNLYCAEYEIKEFIISCIESEFEDDISADFFKCLSINDYELVIEKKCARSVLLVHGNQDYLISSVDLS